MKFQEKLVNFTEELELTREIINIEEATKVLATGRCLIS